VRARNAAGKSIEQLQALTPDQFEEWVGARFRDLGYAVKVTGLSGDHGADLLAEKPGEVAVIQCKNYKAWSVGEPILRDLYGTMHDFKATKAYLVTSGQMTRAAVEWVKGKPIEVWGGDYLANLSMRLASARAEESAVHPIEIPVSTSPAAGSLTAASTNTLQCPKCGSALVERWNKRTQVAFLACPRYPECRYTLPLIPATQ
jgi:restriction system protein